MSVNFLDKIEPYEDCYPVGVLLPKIKLKDKWLKILNLDKNVDSLTFCKSLINHSFKEKGFNNKPNKKEYIDRLKYELEVIEELGFTDYILLNWDILNECHEKDIPVGPGRGSAAGSLVLNVLGVTDKDPIENGLIFERFISRNRAKTIIHNVEKYLDGSLLADVDSDIAYDKRSDVIDYIKKEHEGRVCKISNFSTLTSKICIKEVGKTLCGYSEDDMNSISKLIPSNFGKVFPLHKTREEVEKFDKWCQENEEAFEVACRLENLIKNTGVHASGIAISRQELTDICPLEITSEGELVSCYEMNAISKLTVKFDILGLKTLTVLKDACDLIGIRMTDIDDEDPFIYQQLQDLKHRFGLFQIEAPTNFRVAQDVKPRNLEEASAVVAIARPGALEYAPEYCLRKQEAEEDYLPDSLVNILRETNMVPLYQEQMMRITYETFGFTKDDAETLRKIVGKKLVDKMPIWKEKIYKQAEKIGLDIRVADFFWNLLQKSANYSFNKSHSVCYASLCALTVYVKFKYPLQFFIALLRMSKNETDPYAMIDAVNKELPHFGIKLLPPDLIKSEMDFSVEGNVIRYGLNSIKGISDHIRNSILDFRSSKALNKFDVFCSAKKAKINIGVLCSLIQAGALNSLNDDRAYMVYEAQVFNILTDREKRNWLAFGPKYNYDVFKIWKHEVKEGPNIGDDKKILVNDKRKATIQEKSKNFAAIFKKNSENKDFANWFFEKKLLGYSYNKRLKDIYNTTKPLTGIEELSKMAKDSRAFSVGIITEVYNGRTRAANKKFCRLTISDEAAETTAFIWEEKLEELESDGIIIEKDSIVCFESKRMDESACSILQLSNLKDSIYMKLSDLK